MTSFRFLSDTALEGLGIAPREVADAIEAALLSKAAGRLITTPKSAILPGEARYMMSTLAVGNDEDLTVLKQVSVCPENPGKGLPAINGAILALDAQTGLLRAVLEANWVTAVRTAALSAVAARRLANPEAQVAAFVGTGVQASSHLAAFADMFPLRSVRIVGRGQANIDRLAGEASALGLSVEVPGDPESALDGADLVVSSITLNHDTPPFLDARWLKPGSFAAITDLGIPWVDEGFGAFGQIVVDDRKQEDASPQKMVPPEMVRADLTELVTGTVSLGHDPAHPAAFAFRGIALGDYAATALALRRAEELGCGVPVAGG